MSQVHLRMFAQAWRRLLTHADVCVRMRMYASSYGRLLTNALEALSKVAGSAKKLPKVTGSAKKLPNVVSRTPAYVAYAGASGTRQRGHELKTSSKLQDLT